MSPANKVVALAQQYRLGKIESVFLDDQTGYNEIRFYQLYPEGLVRLQKAGIKFHASTYILSLDKNVISRFIPLQRRELQMWHKQLCEVYIIRDGLQRSYIPTAASLQRLFSLSAKLELACMSPDHFPEYDAWFMSTDRLV